MSIRKRATFSAPSQHAATFLAPIAKVGRCDLGVWQERKGGEGCDASGVCEGFVSDKRFQLAGKARQDG